MTAYVGHGKEEGNVEKRETRCRGEEEEVVAEVEAKLSFAEQTGEWQRSKFEWHKVGRH